MQIDKTLGADHDQGCLQAEVASPPHRGSLLSKHHTQTLTTQIFLLATYHTDHGQAEDVRHRDGGRRQHHLLPSPHHNLHSRPKSVGNSKYWIKTQSKAKCHGLFSLASFNFGTFFIPLKYVSLFVLSTMCPHLIKFDLIKPRIRCQTWPTWYSGGILTNPSRIRKVSEAWLIELVREEKAFPTLFPVWENQVYCTLASDDTFNLVILISPEQSSLSASAC